MTAYSKTIVNTVGVWGLAPPSQWGAFNWGAFKWGEGTNDFAVSVQKLVSNSLSPPSAVAKSTVKALTGGLTTDSTVAKGFSIQLAANTIGVSIDMSDERLQDSEGYYHVFPDRTTSGEARAFTSWTDAADVSVSWATSTVTSTTWS